MPDQPATASAAPKWGDPLDALAQPRKDDLARRLWEWTPDAATKDRPGPFAREPLTSEPLTGLEVFWLAICALAGPHGDVAKAEQRLRAAMDDIRYSLSLEALHLEGGDLRAAHLEGANLSAAHLEGANLSAAHLEGANLSAAAHLEGADLRAAHLEDAFLFAAHLEGANLFAAHLERAYLSDAHLDRAYLRDAHLEGANLSAAHLEGANLSAAHLERANLRDAHLEGADLSAAHLEGADLRAAHLERANLFAAHLEGANLFAAHLEGADLSAAHLEGADLSTAHLEGKPLDPGELSRLQALIPNFPAILQPADLSGAVLDGATNLANVTLGAAHAGAVRVADLRWDDANLAVVDWTPLVERQRWRPFARRPPFYPLGDERAAWEWQPAAFKPPSGKPSRQDLRAARAKHAERQAKAQLDVFRAAVRANRQLATALRDQGMNEEADQFAYRAQVLQRQVFRQQRKRGRAVLSWLLDRVAGHGYLPQRSLITYVAVLLIFASLYLLAGNGLLTFGLASQYHTLPWYEALILSVSSFHGRGFFQPIKSPGDPIAILASLEAIFGLFIEVSFIATFTQRFFGK